MLHVSWLWNVISNEGLGAPYPRDTQSRYQLSRIKSRKFDGIFFKIMSWKIIKEIERKYADSSYYLNAERVCPEGKLVLEVFWVERFMYNISVELYKKDNGRKLLIKKETKPLLLYNCSVFCEDRIEKYGHQIMRITEESPILKLQRLSFLQKDGVLNFNLSEKYNVEFTTTLPAADKE